MIYVLFNPQRLKPLPYVREQVKLFFQKKDTKMIISKDLSFVQEVLDYVKEESKKFPERNATEKEIKMMMLEEDKIDNIVNFLKLYNIDATSFVSEIINEIKEK